MVRAGKGGPGCVSFLRQRFKPRGAADGGDGGDGGDVILEVDPSARTLTFFRHRHTFKATNGQPGRGRQQHGRRGEDCLVPVPPGTLVYEAESSRLLGDLTRPGEQLVVARGGRGGKGNSHFSSSRFRSPRFAQPGEPGSEQRLRLELQLLADVGLVGRPNAGKTTLLTRLTASKAQPAPYPFSTLEPNLGVIADEAREPLVVADIPGLINGAHQGKGLGDRFLRHLQRTRLLIQVVDATQVDPAAPDRVLSSLETEMQAFDPGLLARPRLVVFNKIDLLAPDFPVDALLGNCARTGLPCLAVSAVTGAGLAALRAAVRSTLETLRHEKDNHYPPHPDDHPELG